MTGVARSILLLILSNQPPGTCFPVHPSPGAQSAGCVPRDGVQVGMPRGCLRLQVGTQRTTLCQRGTAAAVSAPLHSPALPEPCALPVPRGVHPSVTTFNCLLAAASDSGSYEALLEVGRGRGRGLGGSGRERGRAGARLPYLHSQRQAVRSGQGEFESSTSPKQRAAASASRLVSPSPLLPLRWGGPWELPTPTPRLPA